LHAPVLFLRPLVRGRDANAKADGRRRVREGGPDADEGGGHRRKVKEDEEQEDDDKHR